MIRPVGSTTSGTGSASSALGEHRPHGESAGDGHRASTEREHRIPPTFPVLGAFYLRVASGDVPHNARPQGHSSRTTERRLGGTGSEVRWPRAAERLGARVRSAGGSGGPRILVCSNGAYSGVSNGASGMVSRCALLARPGTASRSWMCTPIRLVGVSALRCSSWARDGGSRWAPREPASVAR